jgi:hypothetical protein
VSNPLSPLVPVEERNDGVYITVAPGSAVSVDRLIGTAEDAFVTNLNISALKAVVARASNAPAKIGPLFQFYQGECDKYISIAVTDSKARATISSLCIADGVKPTVAAVLYGLSARGVRYGVQRAKIRDALDQGLFDQEIIAAEATDPVPGADGYVKFQIDLSPKTAPLARADGTVDYREIQSFTEVVKDQLIARIIPPTSGTPGITVTGKNIPPPSGKAPFIPMGKNTYLSEDGLNLLASRGGVITYDGNLVNVQELLTIRKDVDFSVGNIK